MKKWLYRLRWNHELVFWEILTSAGNLVCRSLVGFSNENEARIDLRKYHPADHF